jgi:hypothetical protein
MTGRELFETEDSPIAHRERLLHPNGWAALPAGLQGWWNDRAGNLDAISWEAVKAAVAGIGPTFHVKHSEPPP